MALRPLRAREREREREERAREEFGGAAAAAPPEKSELASCARPCSLTPAAQVRLRVRRLHIVFGSECPLPGRG
jgi:hypothetical protein